MKTYYPEKSRCEEVYHDICCKNLLNRLREAEMNGFRWDVFKGTLIVSSQDTLSRLVFDPGGFISSFIRLKSCHLESSGGLLNQCMGDKVRLKHSDL